MSMNATFVQVEGAELSRLRKKPSLAESLFQGESLVPPVFLALGEAMQKRLSAAGPQAIAEKLAGLDPTLRKQLEERLGKLGGSAGGDSILKLMAARSARGAGPRPSAHATLSLDKSWHGVHFLLCGQAEPGMDVLSQAVLGGDALGDDDEGFSGYGPPRAFSVEQVAGIARALGDPELESKAAARFDPERMSGLQIYPGWRAGDADELMGALRRLRDFFAAAARDGRAVVTCLV